MLNWHSTPDPTGKRLVVVVSLWLTNSSPSLSLLNHDLLCLSKNKYDVYPASHDGVRHSMSCVHGSVSRLRKALKPALVSLPMLLHTATFYLCTIYAYLLLDTWGHFSFPVTLFNADAGPEDNPAVTLQTQSAVRARLSTGRAGPGPVSFIYYLISKFKQNIRGLK